MRACELLTTIPTVVLSAARHLRATEVAMAAGPSFVAQRTERFALPLPIAEAVRRLEAYRFAMRIGRVVLEDGRTWFFDRDGFLRTTSARA